MFQITLESTVERLKRAQKKREEDWIKWYTSVLHPSLLEEISESKIEEFKDECL